MAPPDAVGEHGKRDRSNHPAENIKIEDQGHRGAIDSPVLDDGRRGIVERLLVEAVYQHDETAHQE